ncbi:MAG: FHA domain-containing protein [Lachnospiraceae bacterium]|nr:FHA domain-containing protein [Lachnospiraceae bacterium]
MEIEIRNENRRSTMIIRKENFERALLQEKMLLKNSIEGAARLQLSFLNGEAFYRIDLKNYKNLKELFKGRKMDFSEVDHLLRSLSGLIARLDNYLLKAEEILLDPEYIFYDDSAKEWIFICLPYNDDNSGAEKLAEFLVDTVDENDSDAIELSSDYFNIAAEGGISPAALTKKEMKSKKSAKAVKRKKVTRHEMKIPEIPREEYNNKKSAKKTDDPNRKRNLFTGIAICVLLSLMAVGLYILVLMNPQLLFYIGLSGDDYLAAGAIIAVVFAAAIIGVIHFFKKKTDTDKKSGSLHTDMTEAENFYRDDQTDEDFYEMDYLDEEIEKARYCVYESDEYESFGEDEPDRSGLQNEEDKSYIKTYEEDDEEETVLLTDYNRGSGKKASLKGRLKGEELIFNIGEEAFLIGKMKGKANGVINDSGVSRIHACIRKTGNRYFINDLNSTNGTCLNERRLQPDENAEITDGDIIKFGHVTMRFSI